jgi:hypothetical protein
LTEKEYFDFKKNETLNIENIVHSCYLNPDRNLDFSDLPLWTGANDADTLLSKVLNEIPNSLTKFNQAELKLYETEYLYATSDLGEPVDRDEYLKEISNCRWFGPFNSDTNQPCFYSFTGPTERKYWIKIHLDFIKK